MIAHLTSAHARYDTRIYHKMCRSLANFGYDVSLVVADGLGDEVSNGVSVYDAGASEGRMNRMQHAPGRVLKKAISLNADIYHLHDPELIPIGIKLKKLNKRVVFDSHEDVPRQLLAKPYLNRIARWVASQVWRAYEAWACKRFDGVVSATPFICDKFLAINPNTIDINNFPILNELTSHSNWSEKEPTACYVGSISRTRGIVEVAEAMGRVRSAARLDLAGRFGRMDLQQEIQAMPGWGRVNVLGFLERDGVRGVLARSMVGLVTLHPVINYIDALPVKMFEYMSAGIPVIASDFPLWRRIVDGNKCGLLVDPLDPSAIAEAIDTLVRDPAMAQRLGENGRRAVENKYNWQLEEQKLIAFYQSLLGPRE